VEIKRDAVEMTFDVLVAAPRGRVKVVVHGSKADLLGSLYVKVQ